MKTFFFPPSPLNIAFFFFASLSRVETAQTKAFLTLKGFAWRLEMGGDERKKEQARVNAKGTIGKEIMNKNNDWRCDLSRI